MGTTFVIYYKTYFSWVIKKEQSNKFKTRISKVPSGALVPHEGPLVEALTDARLGMRN